MTDPKTYRVNEIFYSLQGEGMRAGTANVFVRLAGCNLKCSRESDEPNSAFDCDTEFVSGRKMTAEEIVDECVRVWPSALAAFERGVVPSIVLTGGEPSLQLDFALAKALKDAGFFLAIETNGTNDLMYDDLGLAVLLNWITVSPKVAEHAIRQRRANEVKYVRGYGQGIPKTVVTADHYLVSPAFDGDQVDARALAWCVELVKQNPRWRLSVQQHKLWQVR